MDDISTKPDVIRTCFVDFDQQLDGHGPLGVAVSGGGDSVALLHALTLWGKRPLEVFCVDHGLNPSSAQWTESVARHAAGLGAGFTALTWRGDKPKTGLSAAARRARHALLAEAARTKGIRVLCLGHTRDDIAEAERMRAHGSNVTAPQAWGPSPAWPEGRGVFLYRPFLNIRRSALRDFLRAQNAGWIDDPANENPASLRARARRTLSGDLPDIAEPAPLLTPAIAEALIDETFMPFGMIAFRREAFAALPPETALRLLSAAVVCAGGGDRLPRRASLESLWQGLCSGKAFTLCGARIRQSEDNIQIARETGDIARHGGGVTSVTAGEEVMWDGRFAVSAAESGRIGPSTQRSQLDDAGRVRLAALPPTLRGGQPVWWRGGRPVLATNAALRQTPYNQGEATCQVGPRFLAAAGLYVRESDLAGPRPWRNAPA